MSNSGDYLGCVKNSRQLASPDYRAVLACGAIGVVLLTFERVAVDLLKLNARLMVVLIVCAKQWRTKMDLEEQLAKIGKHLDEIRKDAIGGAKAEELRKTIIQNVVTGINDAFGKVTGAPKKRKPYKTKRKRKQRSHKPHIYEYGFDKRVFGVIGDAWVTVFDITRKLNLKGTRSRQRVSSALYRLYIEGGFVKKQLFKAGDPYFYEKKIQYNVGRCNKFCVYRRDGSYKDVLSGTIKSKLPAYPADIKEDKPNEEKSSVIGFVPKEDYPDIPAPLFDGYRKQALEALQDGYHFTGGVAKRIGVESRVAYSVLRSLYLDNKIARTWVSCDDPRARDYYNSIEGTGRRSQYIYWYLAEDKNDQV